MSINVHREATGSIYGLSFALPQNNWTPLDKTLAWVQRRLDPYLLSTETGLLYSNKPEVGN